MVAELRCVRFVVIFDDTPEECIRLLRPNLHCKGTDYAPPNGKHDCWFSRWEDGNGRCFLRRTPGQFPSQRAS
jgi:hypothetical protein